jgi:hypothetical protein
MQVAFNQIRGGFTMKIILGVCVFLMTFCGACSNETVVNTTINSTILNSWTHAIEEGSENSNMVFRPSDSKKFPTTRYREVIEFFENDRCRYLVLSPVDAHDFEDGTWQTSGPNNDVLTIRDTSGAVYKRFQVIDLKAGLLRLKLLM